MGDRGDDHERVIIRFPGCLPDSPGQLGAACSSLIQALSAIAVSSHRIDMYTRHESAKQKQAFWTAFGRYMKPILSADGEPIGWLNYKTGNKFVHFSMDVDTRQATMAIVLDHPEADKRQLYFQRFVQLQPILYESLGEQDWIWQSDAFDEHGRPVSLIYKQITGVNFFRNEDWPTVISFFKPRIIALDEYWSMVRYQFSGLI